jgi:hypothetical protein
MPPFFIHQPCIACSLAPGTSRNAGSDSGSRAWYRQSDSGDQKARWRAHPQAVQIGRLTSLPATGQGTHIACGLVVWVKSARPAVSNHQQQWLLRNRWPRKVPTEPMEPTFRSTANAVSRAAFESQTRTLYTCARNLQPCRNSKTQLLSVKRLDRLHKVTSNCSPPPLCSLGPVAWIALN